MKQSRITMALIAVLLICVTIDIGVLRHATPTMVSAEERGTSVSLSYQRGHSTWGPTNVHGAAVLWPIEGVATLSVHLLPHLLNGDRYVWWVVNSHTGASIRLGTFNTTQAGDIFLDTFLARSLPKGANAVLVSIAHRADPLKSPGPARTLYGDMLTQAHPLPLPPALSGTPSSDRPSTSGQGTDGNGTYRPPVSLPMTGGAQLLHTAAKSY